MMILPTPLQGFAVADSRRSTYDSSLSWAGGSQRTFELTKKNYLLRVMKAVEAEGV
jgi:hypothetical protein